MNTTLMFAELLIIGVQVLTWLCLLLLNIFGYAVVQQLQFINIADWQSILLLLVLAVCYMLGVLFDRVADGLFSRWNLRIRNKIFSTPPSSVAVMRFKVVKDNEHLNRHFEYISSRLRIARSSSINFALITLLAIFLVYRIPSTITLDRVTVVYTITVVGLFLTIIAVFAWRKLAFTYFGLVKVTHDSMHPIADDNLLNELLLTSETYESSMLN